MQINQQALYTLLNQAITYNNWIDHLTLNIKATLPKLHDILEILDDDNSNTHFDALGDYKITYTKNHSKNWSFLNITVSIKGIPYTLFQYLEYKKSKQEFLKTIWNFTFYSTYFRLLEKQEIDTDFIELFFWEDYQLIQSFPISRIDYKIDFFFDKKTNFPEKINLIKVRKDSKNEFYTIKTPQQQDSKYQKILANATYYKWDIITWWNIGNKSNKSIFLRMYDKLIDSITKGKVMLYDDYFTYENVFRLEGEFRIKFNKYEELNTKRILPYTYQSLEELKEKCKAYYGLSNTNEKAIVYQYKTNKKITSYTIRNFNDFWWRACKIALQGLNPFTVILNQFSQREKIKKQISEQLLETLIIEFNKKTSLLPLKQKQKCK